MWCIFISQKLERRVGRAENSKDGKELRINARVCLYVNFFAMIMIIER